VRVTNRIVGRALKGYRIRAEEYLSPAAAVNDIRGMGLRRRRVVGAVYADTVRRPVRRLLAPENHRESIGLALSAGALFVHGQGLAIGG